MLPLGVLGTGLAFVLMVTLFRRTGGDPSAMSFADARRPAMAFIELPSRPPPSRARRPRRW